MEKYMSDYVQIYNPDPLTIPAIEEKTFPDFYCIEFVVSQPRDGNQSLVATFRPYNKTTGELYSGADKDYQIILDDVFAEAARVPIFAQAMGYILTSLSLGIQERKLVKAMENTTDETELAALQAQLDAVHTAMGMVTE
jgi:hypothetical protein